LSIKTNVIIDDGLMACLQQDIPIHHNLSRNGFIKFGEFDLYAALCRYVDNPLNNNGKIRTAIKRLGITDDRYVIESSGRRRTYAFSATDSLAVFERIIRNGLVYDYGYNDIEDSIYLDNGKIKPCYRKWCGMLERCYSPKWHIKKPSYKDCYVAPEWLTFSNFKKWFDSNNQEGYVLDKDILIKRNKEYSKETCIFVPEFINSLFIKRQGDRGSLPIGVHKSKGNNYIARISAKGKRIEVGRSAHPFGAFLAYKKAKEEFIKEVASEYLAGGLIGQRVFDALVNYEVEVDD